MYTYVCVYIYIYTHTYTYLGRRGWPMLPVLMLVSSDGLLDTAITSNSKYDKYIISSYNT